MTDYLLEIGKNPTLRRAVRTLGFPLPLPQSLRRARGPFTDLPLKDQNVAVGAAPGSTLIGTIAGTLVRAGANPHVAAEPEISEPFKEPGEAYGRPAKLLPTSTAGTPGTPGTHGTPGTSFRTYGLVFDGSGITDPPSLRALFDFFNPYIRGLETCGRVAVLGRPPTKCKTPEHSAGQAALEGFVRTVAKEIGRKGATAHLITVEEGADERVESLLRFLLSPHSAFVTGQPFQISAAIPKDKNGEPTWTKPLDGRVALVTGAARGIGAATARRLAQEGAHVVCLDRPEDSQHVQRVAQNIDGSVLLADVSASDTPDRIAEELDAAHGGVDIVVHNAGVTRDRTLARMVGELWDQAIDINLSAVTRITRRLEGDLLSDGGRVICLSSIAGLAGNVGQANYAASKAGLVGYTRNLADRLAKRSITVNAVAPGFIETRLTAAVPMMIREAGRRLSSLGQGGLPIDVAELIAYLATPGASGLTGNVIRVCGGGFIGA